MMRTFTRRSSEPLSAVPQVSVLRIERATLAAPAKLVHSRGAIPSVCLNCSGKQCMEFQPSELRHDAPPHARNACPVRAITYMESERTVSFSDECLRCGLCTLRCPVGAIFTDDDARPTTLPFGPSAYRDASEAEVAGFVTQTSRNTTIAATEARRWLARVLSNQAHRDQRTFYPLVGALLTAVGVYTVVTRAGDSNNRIDAVAVDEARSVPIEIKSPEEVEYINVKAVRQALENKVVMIGRSMYPTETDSSTLAVGYRYPNERSDVDELVQDVYGAFQVPIGLLALDTLYELVWRRYVCGDLSAPSVLRCHAPDGTGHFLVRG